MTWLKVSAWAMWTRAAHFGTSSNTCVNSPGMIALGRALPLLGLIGAVIGVVQAIRAGSLDAGG